MNKISSNSIQKKIEYYDIIDSTQLEIHRRIKENRIENGLIIIAEKQTNGKGTHGRVWHTDEKNNIAFSFYKEVNCNSKMLEGITIELAQIILDVFYKLFNIKLNIKSPNDIVYNNKKLGGILTESKINGEITKYIVVGIGINTNQTKFNKDIENIASSIKNEFNINVDNEKIIKQIIELFEIKLKERKVIE